MTASTVLAVCRLISVLHPFYKMKKRTTMTVVTVGTSLQMLLVSYSMLPFGKEDPVLIWNRYSSYTIYVEKTYSTLEKIVALNRIMNIILTAIIGFIASILTIVKLMKQSDTVQRSREVLRKSSKVIAYMKVYNIAVIIGFTISIVKNIHYPILYFHGSVGLIVIGAAFNPLVRVLINNDIYHYSITLLLKHISSRVGNQEPQNVHNTG